MLRTGLRSLFAWALLGRLHQAATPVALSFLIAGWTGSYTIAGVVGGALTVGYGVAGPVRGRAADRAPAARLLVATALSYGLGIFLLGWLPSVLPSGYWPLAVVVAVLVGLAMPPVTQISRAAWPRLASGPALNGVFALEASMQELLYVVGPSVAAFAVAFWSPRSATWLCAALAVAGALGFMVAVRRAGVDSPLEGHRPVDGHLLRDGPLLSGLTVSMTLVSAIVSVDLVLIAWARDGGRPALAGVLAGVWAAASFAGGLLVARWTGPARFPLRILLTALGLAALVPAFGQQSPWLVGVVLFVGGMAIAPAIAANNSLIAALAPPGRQAEAFGWMTTAQTVGSAVALPVAGWFLDHVGAWAATAFAAVIALLAAGLALRVRR
ncbi:MFS transporter [Lentzea sp. NBRC 105346]|uniref:MFS transporter n=1 Tax=Lentzea sp. NBRC 105346 TaxID=3032205 RepID=UPI002552EA94|nr:MFS transporter [Lentzea sp. NBRC 105346]GLZ30383.1 MFS transporter [Lentzea sp. NBRC 105346]